MSNGQEQPQDYFSPNIDENTKDHGVHYNSCNTGSNAGACVQGNNAGDCTSGSGVTF